MNLPPGPEKEFLYFPASRPMRTGESGSTVQGVRMAGSISSVSGSSSTAQIQQMRSQAADRLLKAVDTNKDGKITEDELSTAMGAQGSKKQGASAAELFKQLDTGSKGYITRQDLEAGLAKAAQSTQTQASSTSTPSSSTASTAAGASGASSGGGGGAGSTSATPSPGAAVTTPTFDPEDLNQDGTVTMQEKLQYTAQLYAAQQELQGTSSKQNPIYA
jgi:hypothetical protein